MDNDIESLWPVDIETVRVKAPVAILREQGSVLKQKTGKLVHGEVSPKTIRRERFEFYFDIVSLPLEDYRFKLMTISHGIDLYPVEIEVDRDVFHNIVGPEPQGAYGMLRAESEESFCEILKKIFASDKTVRVVTALLSQADPDWEEDYPWLPRETSDWDDDEDDIPF